MYLSERVQELKIQLPFLAVFPIEVTKQFSLINDKVYFNAK